MRSSNSKNNGITSASARLPSARLRPEQYRLILDSLSEAVCTVDRNWKITSYNRAAQQLTGYTAQEAVQFYFGDIFRCEERECQTLLASVMESGRALQEVNTKFADRNGRRVPVSLNAVPLRNDEGEITGVVATFRDNRPLETLRRELQKDFTSGDIISKNPQMRRLLDILPDLAESGSTVLISGETGTGKELLARALHNASPRRERPFVAVNCGALPETLLESELFGYKKGAFSDARRDKPGRFALAEGGTLFLDEIGDVPPVMQIKLLRVLQEKMYEPLGGVETVRADVRLLAATHRDLEAMVQEGTFRADLYYRLNVIRLELPPLRRRLEDVPLLAEHFLEHLSAEKGRGQKHLSPEALETLLRYEYPGNIRELENIVERAYVLARGNRIGVENIPALDAPVPATRFAPGGVTAAVLPTMPPQNPATGIFSAPLSTAEASAPRFLNLRQLSDHEQREHITEMLRQTGGSRKQTALRLGIDPSTIWRKMRQLGIPG